MTFEEMKLLRSAGKTYAQIAEKAGISAPSVRNYLIAGKIPHGHVKTHDYTKTIMVTEDQKNLIEKYADDHDMYIYAALHEILDIFFK